MSALTKFLWVNCISGNEVTKFTVKQAENVICVEKMERFFYSRHCFVGSVGLQETRNYFC